MKDKIRMLNDKELSAFSMEVAMLLNSGMSLEQGIMYMAESEKDIKGKELLNSIYNDMQIGTSFTKALENSNSFPKYFINMVTMGEKSGELESVFNNLHEFYDYKEELGLNIKSAIMYPCIMVVMMFIVLIVLVTKVLPVFSRVYFDLGSSIPSYISTIIGVGKGVAIASSLILGILIVFFEYKYIFARLKGNNNMFNIENGFTKNGKISLLIAKARLSSVLSMIYSSGIDVLSALDFADNFIENTDVKNKISICREEINNGKSMSEAIETAKIYDGIYEGIVHMGLKSGNGDIALKAVSEKYNDEAQQKIIDTVSSIEPVMVGSLSILIGIIILMVMIPLLSMISAI